MHRTTHLHLCELCGHLRSADRDRDRRTRYRLYEIDRLISRTIGWALVTGVLVVVFAGTVVGLQALLDQVIQGETLAVAASTLVAFALFQPVRRRVQTLVDRRFDRARYDGDRTAAAFAERLRERVDLAGLEADIAGVVDVALRPTTVGVWIRGRARGTRMTRRIVAVTAWLAIAAMNAAWVWAVGPGEFMASMFASLAGEEQRLLTPGMIALPTPPWPASSS